MALPWPACTSIFCTFIVDSLKCCCLLQLCEISLVQVCHCLPDFQRAIAPLSAGVTPLSYDIHFDSSRFAAACAKPCTRGSNSVRVLCVKLSSFRQTPSYICPSQHAESAWTECDVCYPGCKVPLAVRPAGACTSKAVLPQTQLSSQTQAFIRHNGRLAYALPDHRRAGVCRGISA
jgi:hypothetical protein